MDFINKLNNREKVLLIILMIMIFEMSVYSIVFSEKVKNIEEYKYKIENTKLDLKNIKLNSEVKYFDKENTVIKRENNEGFIKEFPQAVISTVEENKIIDISLKKEELFKLLNLSDYYSYDNATLTQDLEGYRLNFTFKSNSSSILPQIVASEGDIKSKIFKEKLYEKNKNNKIVSTVNDSKSVKVNKSESKEVERKETVLPTSKQKNKIESITKQEIRENIEVLENEKVHSNFNVNAEDCSLLKNDDSSEAMISAMENGFNLYYKSKGESTLDIVLNKVEHLKKIKILVSSYLETKALLEIKGEEYIISRGKNEIELNEASIDKISLKLTSDEENLLSFVIEGEL
ncbi:hypothetical protein [Peptoniphilus indolicus]|uniref:Uncharacterized protein n=2 Tax=Peptoniphilus indolicus TaxID=33030 RepID=A0A379DE47_9FIRM|nr:hypothetical protein [Peptoniphilus indolicus]SUB76187.1 Uncharacterised protein [Peptoniphilus indolicus]